MNLLAFAVSEVDRNLKFGGRFSARHWGRPDDHFSLACIVGGLSRDHVDYLAPGGSSFVLGDGRLRYSAEGIVDAYYSLRIIPHVLIIPDLEFIRNPGYNRDRGRAKFASLGRHLEF